MKIAAQSGSLNLLYLDESGFSTVPSVQRAWSPLGQPHQADASVGKKRVNVLGALDPVHQILWHAESEKSMQRTEVVNFIDQVAQHHSQEIPTIVVLDNAAIHCHIDADKIHEWGSKNRLFLFYLPPYSPELNLIEILWKQAKYYWRKFESWTRQELLHKVQELFSDYGEKFEIHYA